MRVCVALICFAAAMSAESVAGLQWTAPAGWKSEGTRPMRAATYNLAAAAGDKEGAECAIYFFGKGDGGSVEANLERWKDQVVAPSGQPAAAKIQKRMVHGLAVTTIDSTGEYAGMGSGPKQGYRLIGAVIEGPGGNVFIKFTGPAKTVGQNQPKFEQMLASFEKTH